MSLIDLLNLNKIPEITSALPAKTSVYSLDVELLDGTVLSLSQFKGKKILFVNVASKCGFTQQYSDLQALYKELRETLAVIGLPCNQFGYQEKGTAEEIQTFCRVNYGVTFPVTAKIEVKGHNQHAIYSWLTQKELNGSTDSTVNWNFQKYLVNEHGNLQAIFSPKTLPLSDQLITELER